MERKTTESEPELLRTREAAQLTSLSGRTLMRYAAAGTCPKPVKLGNGKQSALRWSRRALLEWVSAGCPRCDSNGEG